MLGITKQEFSQFMKKMQLNEQISKKIFIQLEDIGNIFDLFDNNKLGVLDFRYFYN